MAEQFLDDTRSSALMEAIESNFIGFTTAYIQAAQGRIHSDPEVTWIMSDSGMVYYNGVFRTRLSTSSADALIGAMQAQFQHRMGWWITPLTRPADLAERLTAHGFARILQDIGMAANLHQLREPASQPVGLTIERVEDEEIMRTWALTFGLGFELDEDKTETYRKLVQSVPPAQHSVAFYLARLAGKPVATSALYCGSGVAGLYEVSTIPALRGRGIGTAIALAPCAMHARWAIMSLFCKPQRWARRSTSVWALRAMARWTPISGTRPNSRSPVRCLRVVRRLCRLCR